MANKVKFGLTNVYFSVATIDATDNTATYATPVRLPGAVNLTLDHEGSSEKFYADNVAYYTSQGDAGYNGTLELATIPDAFRKAILGDVEDANGCLTETATTATVPFALLFQFDGDDENTRHVLYNCTASKPQISGETTSDSVTPQTETLNITAAPIHNENLGTSGVGLDVYKARALASDTPYATWYSAVYQGSRS